MSFDFPNGFKTQKELVSQSLSSRAMSFDYVIRRFKLNHLVSIPFEQGDVFRLDDEQMDLGDMSQSLSSRAMSFDQIKLIN